MNAQQVVQPRSANGYGRRRVDREMGARMENMMHSRKSSSSNLCDAGLMSGGKLEWLGSPSRDRLIYVTTCLVGHFVEVHVKNGSIISGIFHAANVEKDFGIVLKMARVTNDNSVRGQKPVSDTVKKPQNMIILASELVQIIAKEIPLSNAEFTNGHLCETRHDLMIDSTISNSHHVEVERELHRWTPDEDVPECPELDNIFDSTWNRHWDQFETNEALFGVKSTFNEDIYTTKLERGPQMRNLEKEASRIAREIEEEETQDLHLAEERGIHFCDDFDLDEESRFSAVARGLDDRINNDVDSILESHNVKMFGGSFGSVISRSYSNASRKMVADEAQASSTCSLVGGEKASSHICFHNQFGSSNYVSQLTSDCVAKKSRTVDSETRLDDEQQKDYDGEKSSLNEYLETLSPDEVQTPNLEELQTTNNLLAPDGAACFPTVQENRHFGSEPSEFGKLSSVASVSNGRGLSPSSSKGSLSSEKSTLNPYAKEFKLNPNANSFSPSASLRVQNSRSDESFYHASNISAYPHVNNLPMGIGIGPSYGAQQSVVYNPQAAHLQTQQAYIQHNGPFYGQQMIVGQPPPAFYMPTYPPEMPYKGRNF